MNWNKETRTWSGVSPLKFRSAYIERGCVRLKRSGPGDRKSAYEHHRQINIRHANFRYTYLKKEGTPETDPLHRLNFYSALVQDARCHYCDGKLNETGCGLDAMDNSISHTCYNVVPCCWDCNQLKGARFSYEEMMLLSPGLRQIKRARPLEPQKRNVLGRPKKLVGVCD